MRDKRQKVPNQIDMKPVGAMEVEYAKKIGITLPMDATKGDARALFARELDDDEAASSALLAYARRKGMKCSDYIGIKSLYTQLFDHLGLLDKTIFFAYCVYKFYWNSEIDDVESHPDYLVFEAFGKTYERDGYFVASMEDYIGEELVAFGKSKRVIRGKEKTIYGASAHTRAHNVAYEYLKNAL